LVGSIVETIDALRYVPVTDKGEVGSFAPDLDRCLQMNRTGVKRLGISQAVNARWTGEQGRLPRSLANRWPVREKGKSYLTTDEMI
jgi:hypothetical protein